MSIFSTIADLFSGAGEQVQNLSDSVQNIGENEVVQNVQDHASEAGSQAQDIAGDLSSQAQGVVDNLKDKLGQ